MSGRIEPVQGAGGVEAHLFEEFEELRVRVGVKAGRAALAETPGGFALGAGAQEAALQAADFADGIAGSAFERFDAAQETRLDLFG